MAEYNESQINSNETERISAEQERIENEAQRQTNETEREARETIRQSNESTRITFMADVHNTEDERIANEQVRINAENIRMANEDERLRKEIERQNAEELRQITYNSSLYGRMDEAEDRLNQVDSQLAHNTNNINLLTNYVTPEMFGAKGDGVTDDFEAFQLAFNTGYNVICGSRKRYNLIGGIINVGDKSVCLDLNNSNLLDACFSFNLNENLTDWKNAYSPHSFTVCNGSIGTDLSHRKHDKECVFLVGGYLKLENLRIFRTPHLVAHAERFIDNFEMINILNNTYQETLEDYKDLDCINVIRRSDGKIVKSSGVTFSQGDGWYFKRVNEFHSDIKKDYKLITLNFHQAVKFELCIQFSVGLGNRNVAIFEGCHFESINANPKFTTDFLVDSNITFLGCAFINNYTILDNICVSYINCKFNLGYEVEKMWSDVFEKRLINYSCKFINCSTCDYGIIDNYKMMSIWNTPICCNVSEYFQNQIKNISLYELKSDQFKGNIDDLGTYEVTVYIHLDNNLNKAYHKYTTTLTKTTKNSAIVSGYFQINGCVIEVYLTKPNGEIKSGWIKIQNIDNATTLGSNVPRYNQIVITNNMISLKNENPHDIIYDTMQTVTNIPDREITTSISKF